ncbi:MAG: hypothetical protein ACE5HR_05180 [bacterium]
METSEFDRILSQILSSFKIRYVDFGKLQFRPYKDRRIGGVVRIDTGEIMIDKNLSGAEEDRTWVHEILSIHYYFRGILKHDEEIEKETRKICRDHQKCLILKRYQKRLAPLFSL